MLVFYGVGTGLGAALSILLFIAHGKLCVPEVRVERAGGGSQKGTIR
jgi:hypothetical protein